MRARQNRRRHSRFATDLERDPMTTRWAAAERWRVYCFLGYYHLLFFAGQFIFFFPAIEYTLYILSLKILLCVWPTRRKVPTRLSIPYGCCTYATMPPGYCGQQTAAAAAAFIAAYACTVRLFFFYRRRAHCCRHEHTPRCRRIYTSGAADEKNNKYNQLGVVKYLGRGGIRAAMMAF